MVNIKISRFSRAKKTEPIIQNEINEPLTFDNIEGNNFLDDLNNLNYKPDEPPI